MDRTIKLSRRSIPVRIYTSRIWKGNHPEKADFCTLFWATVLAPIAAAIYVYINVPAFVLRGTKRAVDHTLIEHTAIKGDQLAAWWQRTGMIVAVIAFGVCALAILALIAYGFYVNPVVTALTMGGIAVSFALLMGLMWWLFERDGDRFFIAGAKAVKNRTCPRVQIEP